MPKKRSAAQGKKTADKMEELSSFILQMTHDAIITFDEEQRILFFNSGAEQVFGYKSSEATGQPLEILLPPHVADFHRAYVNRFSQSPLDARLMGERQEISGRRKDGTIFPAEASIAKLTSEGKVFFVVILRDITERKQTVQVLHKSLETHRMILNGIDEIVYQIRQPIDNPYGGVVEYVSERTREVLGYQPSDFIADPQRWISLIHPDDLAALQAQTEKIIESGLPGLREYRIKDASGQYRWLEDRISPEKDETDHMVRVIGVARDVTERKQAEAERLQLQRVLESSLNEIYIFDAESLLFQYVNQGALRNLGYTREAMSRMTPLDIKPEFDPASFRALIQPLLSHEKEKLEFNAVHRRADGSLYPVEVHLQVSEFRGKRVFYAIILDITERRKAEQETLKLLNAVEQSADIIFITDREGAIEYVNPAFESITGFSREEAVGRTPKFLSSGAMDKKVFESMWATIQAGNVFRREIPDRKKSGEIFYYDQTITPLKNEHGEITHFVSTGKDVTESKRAEEVIRQRLNELEVLYESGLAMSQLLQPNDVAQKIIELLEKKLKWHHTAIRLYHPHDETLELLAFNQPGLTTEQEKKLVEERFKTRIARKGQGFSGWVVEHGHSVRASNLMGDERYVETFPGLQSGLYVPMIIGERIIGVISIESEAANAFSEADERLTITLANQAASALENARLFSETMRRLDELEALREVSQAVTQISKLEALLQNILDAAVHVIPAAEKGAILLADEQGNLYIRALSGYSDTRILGSSFPSTSGYSARAFREKQPLIINDARGEDEIRYDGEIDEMRSVKSAIVAPLMIQDQVNGIISIDNVTHKGAFTEDDLRLLSTIASSAALSIHNSRLLEETRQRLARIEALHEIDMTIANTADLRLMLGAVLKQAQSLLHVDAASVLLFNPTSSRLEFSVGRGFRTREIETASIPLGSNFAGRAALEQRLIQVLDYETAKGNSEFAKFWMAEGMAAYYVVPLLAKGQVKGVMEVFRRAPHPPTENLKEWIRFLETLAGQAALAVENVRLFEGMQRANFELTIAYDTTIEGWSQAMDLRDKETEGHTQRVTELTLRLARAFGVGEGEIVHIRRGALLHDIGKIGVPDHILLKPDNLTDEEWALMKQHPQFAYNMLSPIPYLRPALDIPYCHHEKWDGSGYPRGLKGVEIPLAARMFALVDVYDALTSDRPYRAAWPKQKVLNYIREQGGAHFDPHLVDTFIAVVERLEDRKP